MRWKYVYILMIFLQRVTSHSQSKYLQPPTVNKINWMFIHWGSYSYILMLFSSKQWVANYIVARNSPISYLVLFLFFSVILFTLNKSRNLNGILKKTPAEMWIGISYSQRSIIGLQLSNRIVCDKQLFWKMHC